MRGERLICKRLRKSKSKVELSRQGGRRKKGSGKNICKLKVHLHFKLKHDQKERERRDK